MGFSISINESGSQIAHLLARLNPRHELCIVFALKVGTLHTVDNAPGALLFLFIEGQQIAFFALLVGLQISAHQLFGHHEGHGLASVQVVGFNGYIVDIGAYTQCYV